MDDSYLFHNLNELYSYEVSWRGRSLRVLIEKESVHIIGLVVN